MLVVPIAFVSDHVETAFELDMEVREEAEEAGIEHYEVMTGLNDHPAFIDALASVSKAHLGLTALPPVEQAPAKERKLACHQCIQNAEPLCWHKRTAAALS